MKKSTNSQIQKVHRTLSKVNIKETTSRHTIIKLHSIRCKEKIIKEDRKKRNIMYRETKPRKTATSPQEQCQQDSGVTSVKC